ncbi:MAG: PAS domain-containing protein, partial [Desulfovibrionales bacterium]
MIEPHKRWTLYNNRFLRMWNLKEPSEASEGEMLEKILGQVVDRKAFLTGFTIRFEDGKDEYMDIVQCKDGRFMERSFQPLFVDGSYVGRIATFRDVTDQVVYERELARSQETLQAILNGMSSYVYVIDLQTHEILFANKFLQDFIGSNPVGRKCWKIFHDRISGPCPSCLTPNLYDRDSAGHYECELYNEKFERWFFLQKRIIRWDDGRMALLEIAIDVTARKQAEEEMLRAKDFSETLIRRKIHCASSLNP